MIVLGMSVHSFCNGVSNRRNYQAAIQEYVESSDGVKILEDDYTTEHWGPHYGAFGPKAPRPWYGDAGGYWTRATIPWYFSNNEKPLTFLPDTNKITPSDLVWDNDSLKLFARKGAWWIVLRGNGAENCHITTLQNNYNRCDLHLLQRMGFFRHITYPLPTFPAPSMLIISQRDDVTATEIAICNENDDEIAVIQLPQ